MRLTRSAASGRYEKSSFGWNPARKKKEIFHKLGRFILVRSKESTEVVAFTTFRFEDEEEFGVVYWSVACLSPSNCFSIQRIKLNIKKPSLTAMNFTFPLRSTDVD